MRRALRPFHQSECLDKLVLLGEGHLRAAIREYLAHYRRERIHQGLDSQLIVPPAKRDGVLNQDLARANELKRRIYARLGLRAEAARSTATASS